MKNFRDEWERAEGTCLFCGGYENCPEKSKSSFKTCDEFSPTADPERISAARTAIKVHDGARFRAENIKKGRKKGDDYE